MKTLSLRVALAASLLTFAPAALLAQAPVSTGIIVSVDPKAGEMTMQSDQLKKAVTFYGLNSVNIFHVDGQVAPMTDLEPGRHVTIEYAERQGRWYISKVMLNPKRSVVPAPVVPVVRSNVAPLIYRGP